jgi:dTDP-glucose 4,6-dehydratase
MEGRHGCAGAARAVGGLGAMSGPPCQSIKLLVTGGSGFIGSNFIRWVLNEHPDDRIVNLDKLTYAGNPANLADVEADPRYAFVHGDICDAKLVRDVAQGVDAVVNFAAPSHVDRSILEPDEFLRTNVLGVHVLLEAVRERRIPRLLHVSTDEVYGSIPRGAADESAPLRPTNPYSAAKAGGDLLALAYWNTHRVPVVVTRSSNNFGPHQYPEKLVPLFVTNALEDRPLPLYGDGGQARDWLYVLDNCAAIDLVLRRGREGEVYNIGGGHEVTNLTLTREILRLLGKPEGLVQPVADRPGHDRRYALDAGKIAQLGWAPRHPFAPALESTVRWYREHEAWWRPLKSGEFRAYYERQYGPR